MSALADQPAFPQHFIYEPDKGASGVYTAAHEIGFGGITFRQYAAVEAMKGLLSGQTTFPKGTTPNEAGERVARASCFYADALIAELKKIPS